MTAPAVQRLRERFPTAQITLLTTEKLAALWTAHRALDQVLTFSSGETPWSVARRLRPQNFDLAVVLPNSPRSAIEVWLARIPARIGYSRPWRNWFLTKAVPARPDRVPMRKRSAHEIKQLLRREESKPSAQALRPAVPARAHQIHEYLHLVGVLGANCEPLSPALHLQEEELRAAERRLIAELKTLPRKSDREPPLWLGLNPSAAYGPAKRWPMKNFAEVAVQVSRALPNCVWLVFGTGDDASLCHEVSRLVDGTVIDLAGKTTLRELMALLKLCQALVSNDSGPMHLAAALGTPVVVPFGSTAPELTGPCVSGNRPHQLLRSGAPCSPCFRRTCPIDLRCMTGITVERVVEAVVQSISPGSASTR